jgi:hypothetical protein
MKAMCSALPSTAKSGLFVTLFWLSVKWRSGVLRLCRSRSLRGGDFSGMGAVVGWFFRRSAQRERISSRAAVQSRSGWVCALTASRGRGGRFSRKLESPRNVAIEATIWRPVLPIPFTIDSRTGILLSGHN